MIGVGAKRGADGQQKSPQAVALRRQRDIDMSLSVPGTVRFDLYVDKSMVGRIIGAGGKTYKEITSKTGAALHIDDETQMAGYPEGTRHVCITGQPANVEACKLSVDELLRGVIERLQKDSMKASARPSAMTGAQQFAPPAQQFAPPAQHFAQTAQQFAPPVQPPQPPQTAYAPPPGYAPAPPGFILVPGVPAGYPPPPPGFTYAPINPYAPPPYEIPYAEYAGATYTDAPSTPLETPLATMLPPAMPPPAMQLYASGAPAAAFEGSDLGSFGGSIPYPA